MGRSSRFGGSGGLSGLSWAGGLRSLRGAGSLRGLRGFSGSRSLSGPCGLGWPVSRLGRPVRGLGGSVGRLGRLVGRLVGIGGGPELERPSSLYVNPHRRGIIEKCKSDEKVEEAPEGGGRLGATVHGGARLRKGWPGVQLFLHPFLYTVQSLPLMKCPRCHSCSYYPLLRMVIVWRHSVWQDLSRIHRNTI